MNKVITINLGGNAYQLEEGGYDALRAYLETATTRLQANPDREEIISDIELAIGEKFRALLGSNKTVVVGKEVSAVLAEMGTIEADSGEATVAGAASASAAGGTGASSTGGAATDRPPGSSPKPKRFYRIREGDMIAGVCNGLAVYLNIDPTFVRLAFVFLAMVWGTGVIVYIVMAIVVPEATSPEEKAAASGNPSTAKEFIRRAKEGYYEAMKGFPDRQARREWKRRFKREMRAHADQWRFHWHGWGPENTPVHPGMGFALPFLSLLQGMAKILGICALISLLATGAIFGKALPANVPVWVAALLLLAAYGIIAGPLKLARRACYYGMGRPGWSWPFVFLMDAIVWVVVVATLLWLAFHYFPELSDAVKSIPSLVHQAAGDIRNWWK
jgi:phage shock protein PspC (stress-responsive transcriptional regulator)